jgi:hypothetical protein
MAAKEWGLGVGVPVGKSVGESMDLLTLQCLLCPVLERGSSGRIGGEGKGRCTNRGVWDKRLNQGCNGGGSGEAVGGWGMSRSSSVRECRRERMRGKGSTK